MLLVYTLQHTDKGHTVTYVAINPVASYLSELYLTRLTHKVNARLYAYKPHKAPHDAHIQHAYAARLGCCREQEPQLCLPSSIFLRMTCSAWYTVPSMSPLTAKMPPTMAHTLVRKCRNEARCSWMCTLIGDRS